MFAVEDAMRGKMYIAIARQFTASCEFTIGSEIYGFQGEPRRSDVKNTLSLKPTKWKPLD